MLSQHKVAGGGCEGRGGEGEEFAEFSRGPPTTEEGQVIFVYIYVYIYTYIYICI
jgi:hypothetical protein